MDLSALRRQIGQLFVIGFSGHQLADGHPIIADIRDSRLGGVILFDQLLAKGGKPNNIIGAEQLKTLTATLQEAAGGRLLIAVDQEGGKVSRFKGERGFAETPAAAELGLDPSLTATAAAAGSTATMLGQLGINWNLAPVVDLDSFPDNPIIGRYRRSFAAEPDTVISHARAWITAHRQKGLLSCLKHFPGHGSSRGDSHQGLVDVSDSWDEQELLPYRRLIDEGLADAVMVGHLCNRRLDPHYPASLSGATVTGLLRGELGFSGLVITDDLQMGAVTSWHRLEEACCLAFAAGVDMIILGNNLVQIPGLLNRMSEAVLAALRTGQMTRKRINQAWQRVEELKKKIGAGHAAA
jgi:beta-N-acetylhexosaminidase